MKFRSFVVAGILGLSGLIANNTEEKLRGDEIEKRVEQILQNDYLSVYCLVRELGEEYEYSGEKKARKVELKGDYVDFKCIALEDKDKIWFEVEERNQGIPIRTYFDGIRGRFDGKVDAYGIWLKEENHGIQRYSLVEIGNGGNNMEVQELRQRSYDLLLKEAKKILIEQAYEKYKEGR